MDKRDNPNTRGFPPGIYERLVDAEMEHRLAETDAEMIARTNLSKAPIASADAIELYLRRELQRVLRGTVSAADQLEIAERVLGALLPEDQATRHLQDDVLLAVQGGSFSQAPDALQARPSTPLSSNAIFTAVESDPQLYYELNREIRSADLIYLVVSFIRWSGLDLLLNALEEFTKRGGKLRVLTTTYMGITQIGAIERLAALPGTKIRISLYAEKTRLHAKAYVFWRESGFSTAYVGSSNMSRSALTEGYEWNTKIAAVDSPRLFNKVLVTCEQYWNDPEFILFDPVHHDDVEAALSAARSHGPDSAEDLPYGECRPFPFQEEVLERLAAERLLHDRWHNLVVAATGTGKTMISAFDYRRCRADDPGRPWRILFVAHREEILRQSVETYRRVLGDKQFGELHVGEHKAVHNDHLFISVQSANAADLCEKLPPKHFDYIVVDEFHHAAAPSYQKILTHFQPKILLGLTATPERMDGKSILDYFDGRIAAEIRLPAAIDQDLLCPFHYFGLSDTVDLDQVRWKHGGYDVNDLNHLYSLDAHVARKRAEHILQSLRKHTLKLEDVKALGFCVSVEHANFMADYFKERGVACTAVSGNTSKEERHRAIADLEEGRLNIIFCVDLFNEGVDIPAVNTVLFLRPTESLTVFLQQLGRGLRLCEGKDYLLVLDFIGQANHSYRFDEKFGALLRTNKRGLRKEVKERFPSMPRGCSIELEEKPMQIILQNIRQGFSSRAALLQMMEDYIEEHGTAPTLPDFLRTNHIAPQELYKVSTFAQLLAAAGVPGIKVSNMPNEFQAGLARLSGANAPQWMQFLVTSLPTLAEVDVRTLPVEEQMMIGMFYLTIWNVDMENYGDDEMRANLALLASSPVLLNETTALLQYLIAVNERLSWAVDLGYPCPLEVHGTYTRRQIGAALGHYRSNLREGVLWLPDLKTDVLFVTLDKDSGHFTESIAYADYAVSSTRFHWQSQNSTKPTSSVGQRYINQRKNGTHVLLFVRQANKDAYGQTEPFRFLGPAHFVSTTGSKPMNIIWELDYPMDPMFLQAASRLVV